MKIALCMFLALAYFSLPGGGPQNSDSAAVYLHDNVCQGGFDTFVPMVYITRFDPPYEEEVRISKDHGKFQIHRTWFEHYISMDGFHFATAKQTGAEMVAGTCQPLMRTFPPEALKILKQFYPSLK